MNAMTKIVAAVVMTGATSFVSTSAIAWWDNDRYDRYNRYDRWYGGPWYGGYPVWGGYPGPGWANYPGYRRGSTIIVNPSRGDRFGGRSSEFVSEPRVPR